MRIARGRQALNALWTLIYNSEVIDAILRTGDLTGLEQAIAALRSDAREPNHKEYLELLELKITAERKAEAAWERNIQDDLADLREYDR